MTPQTTVLVTGSGGQLGRYLRDALVRDGYRVIGIGSRAADGVDRAVDIVDGPAVASLMADVRPDIVIHGAAWTDVDGCEREPERADAVNHLGSRNVANEADRQGAWLIGIGTDFVFSGNGGAPYDERATADPASVYGSSKLAGERAILEVGSRFSVARTAWVFGGAGKHFPRTVLTVVRDRGAMEVVDDETGNPTFAGDLAEALVALLSERPAGVLHLTNSGAVSRFELARAVVAAAGGDPSVIVPTTTAAFLEKYPLPAKRPPNSALTNSRAASLGVTLPPWRDAVDRYVPRLAQELGFTATATSQE